MPDLEQRWYTAEEMIVLPLDVAFWWSCGPAGIVRLRDHWTTREYIETGKATHVWPVATPLPPERESK